MDSLEKKIESVEVIRAEKVIVIEETAAFWGASALAVRTETKYMIGSGGIELWCRVVNESGADTLPRIGRIFKLPKRFNAVTWYGRGPWENYCDRKDSALIGTYKSTVEG